MINDVFGWKIWIVWNPICIKTKAIDYGFLWKEESFFWHGPYYQYTSRNLLMTNILIISRFYVSCVGIASNTMYLSPAKRSFYSSGGWNQYAMHHRTHANHWITCILPNLSWNAPCNQIFHEVSQKHMASPLVGHVNFIALILCAKCQSHIKSKGTLPEDACKASDSVSIDKYVVNTQSRLQSRAKQEFKVSNWM